MNPEVVRALDRADPLARYREQFTLPADTIYFDGNSLGAMPKGVQTRLLSTLNQQWSQDLIRSWNKHAWIDLPIKVGEKIAPLIGAAPRQVICTDSTSINIFKLLMTALKLRPDRKEILSQADNFPTDLYVAQGIAGMFPAETVTVTACEEHLLAESLSTNTAVLMLTHTNFRSGKLHDLLEITSLAHDVGALVLWDLSHSAGAMPISLDDCGVDMAVGCGYKYLNGGPGAPAFLYLSRALQGRVTQPLTGWMGHQRPFDFDPVYAPGDGVLQYLCGTPSVLAMVALDAALDVFADVDLQQVRNKSLQLGELFISLVEEAKCGFDLLSPRDGNQRGSQVSFTHDQGYAIIQALIACGVIGDFRDPNVMRFGFTPLYTRYQDVVKAVEILAEVMDGKRYLEPQFQQRNRVT